MGKDPATTFVVIDEVPLANWGIGGVPVAEWRTRRTWLTLPAVVNAPMAGIAGGALAAAVTRAGGLGFIGGGYGDAAWIDEWLDIAAGTAGRCWLDHVGAG